MASASVITASYPDAENELFSHCVTGLTSFPCTASTAWLNAVTAGFVTGLPTTTARKYLSKFALPIAPRSGEKYDVDGVPLVPMIGTREPSCLSSPKNVAAVGPSDSVMMACGFAASSRATADRYDGWSGVRFSWSARAMPTLVSPCTTPGRSPWDPVSVPNTVATRVYPCRLAHSAIASPLAGSGGTSPHQQAHDDRANADRPAAGTNSARR